MGKQPAFQFYPGDWTRDLEEHPLEIEGAWIRICCKLWWSETRGSLTKTLTQWARILRVTEEKTVEILTYIRAEGIGDVPLGFPLDLTLPNKEITVVSRRMFREFKAQENNRIRQKRHYDKVKYNTNLTPPSSSSSSSSSSKEDKNNPPTPLKGGDLCSQNFMHPDYQEFKKTGNEILAYLNRAAGKNFKDNYYGFREIINRLQEQRKKEEFITIIDKKLKDTKFSRNYMRPETLFTQANFDKYLYEDEKEYEQSPQTKSKHGDYMKHTDHDPHYWDDVVPDVICSPDDPEEEPAEQGEDDART